jgi:hypothetical protein
MNSYNRLNNLVGWAVFLFAAVVYYFSAEPTGSLWDCGEFVSCADKLQVPHPPGAPLFLLIGRLFMWVGSLISSDPAFKTHLLNFSSGVYSALAAMFVCWVTIILGKLAMVGRTEEPSRSQFIALAGAGAVAGLTTAFCTSIWFSAVEGEVYAMSTFFTAFTLWAMIKWYNQPDTPQADRWMLLSVYAAGLSIGVHLLSLLTFPALALFYYFKKTEKPTWLGMLAYGFGGVLLIGLIQSIVITGIPAVWGSLEVTFSNMGLPRYISSLIFLVALLGGGLYAGLRWAKNAGSTTLQNVFLGLALLIVSFSTFGMTMIRAAANPPINMNAPSDPLRLIPYLNREQYGERPLLFGPQFNQKRPSGGYDKVADRYGWTGKKYEVVDQRMEPVFGDRQKMFFPRMGHWEGDREPYYKYWLGINEKDPVPASRPSMGDNFSYFVNYQTRWMYWRYFMWNFSGRQNGEQGYTPSEMKGHWITGISFIDESLLGLPGKTSQMSDQMKTDPARNTYFMLPFLFGVFGLIWHFRRRQYDALGILALFLITGMGIVVYTNEPPNEPRERDYALVGSFFTYAIWVGMGVLAIFDLLRTRLADNLAAPISTAIVAIAPFLMLTQNFDDHSRRTHTAARDYAVNFLESCDKDAIIFTYGDNDTYPLWYAQEVENIRTDVRVVNLSLLGTDWYINQLRRKMNNSPAIKISLPESAIRGDKRAQIPVMKNATEMSLVDVVRFIGESHPQTTEGGYTFESYAPSEKVFLPVDKQKMMANGLLSAQDTGVVDKISFTLGEALMRDDIAVLDIIANNFADRPIYFAVTASSQKMQGLNNYAQLEGLSVRLLPIATADPMARQFGIIGAGRVARDKIFDRVNNKFKWGHFDDHKTYVDKNYRPSVQTTRFVALRTAMDMINNKEEAKAVALADKMFAAYPNMNFPYDNETLYFLDVYSRAGEVGKEGFKKHARILSNNVLQNLKFYKSVSSSIRRLRGIDIDEAYEMRLKDEIIRVSGAIKDEAFTKELTELFKEFPSPQGAAPQVQPLGN